MAQAQDHPAGERSEVEAGAAGHGAEPRGKRTEDGQATYLVAIAEALWEEMERDERVFMLGEDIGVYGGAFKVTEGFYERFGAERVIDTPIAEETIVGMAIGSAMEGFRPVAEFQYSDFMTSGFDEISTALAGCTTGAVCRCRWSSAAPPEAWSAPRPSTRSTRSRGSPTRAGSRSSARPSRRTRRAC